MGDRKFRAFISYSHADEHWGAWLQRSLEQFRAPKELARQIEAAGQPLRLSPVFRDREDLPVAGNLNDAIQKALADSEFQIVLCSPNAAKSRWVNEEIKLFNRLHGPGRTFAIIVAGEPGGGEQECFPPALRFKLDKNGEPTAEPAEPLAADAREGGDGKRYALLKTAAGMLGVGLDDLVRRDAQRRARRARAIALVTSGVAGLMAFATLYAVRQRDEARTARGEAEELVEFMLSDLSDRLEPVGKLDILEEVGGEVLAYYADQDIKKLDAEALSRRAQALMKLGQVDQRRGDLDAALKAYEAAFASTEEQLRRAPNDPDRIFDHAQSVFYLGEISRVRGDYTSTEARFSQYLDYAEKLVSIDADNPKWRLELAYGTANLGALAFSRGEYARSLTYFERSAAARETLSAKSPEDQKIAYAFAYALSWKAYSELALGKYEDAVRSIGKQLSIYDRFQSRLDEADYQTLEWKITARRRLAQSFLALGDLTAAWSASESASAMGNALLSREPENVVSLANVTITERMRSYLAGLKGDHQEEKFAAVRSVEFARKIVDRDATNLSARTNLGFALSRMVMARAPGGEAAASELRSMLEDDSNAPLFEDPDLYSAVTLALAQRATAEGDIAGADRITSIAADRLRQRAASLTADARRTFATLLFAAGDRSEADRICSELWAAGVRHPELATLRERLIAAAPT